MSNANERKNLSSWDRVMMAISFAEAGEAKTAKAILDKSDQKRPDNRIEEQEANQPELRL